MNNYMLLLLKMGTWFQFISNYFFLSILIHIEIMYEFETRFELFEVLNFIIYVIKKKYDFTRINKLIAFQNVLYL